ncbi:hypothetical protein PCANC_15352 [Puccinia coronata f. sp. avenae]|uniref:OPT family small oligopeptide transporter n=1 Tax=Puccinia coronata f. sp. avenae TaxID=200324 RepID=A0A2N5SS50_9BASI|nr:hypothetical protein PCANC_15352 [Puccinia coronata f. sp. avenae]
MSENTAGYVKLDTDETADTFQELAQQEGDLLLRPIVHHDTLNQASSHDASPGITEAKRRPGESARNQHDRGAKHPEGTAESMVEKVVPESDDPAMLTNTIRVWFIGVTLGAMCAGINQIFSFKSNGINFGGFFIILVSYAAGKLMAATLPSWNIKFLNPFGFLSTRRPNRWVWEVSLSLNPGEFSVKEHILIGVLAGCASAAAYAGDIVAVQDLYYHQDMGHFGALLLLLSTQLLGFSLAGLTYSILIRPTRMIWPMALVVVTLYNTLHAVGDDTQESREFMKDRMRFFTTVFMLIFVYQHIDFMFDRQPLHIYEGFRVGVHRSWPIDYFARLDGHWLSSLFTPFFASFNFFAGMALSMWIVVPLMWYCDFWNNRSFGDNAVSARLFDQYYRKYSISAVVKSDFTLDEQKFQELGPIQLTPYFAASYGVGFAVLTSALMTVFLFHSEDIKSAISARNKISTDVHIEIMERHYESVPTKWYAWIGGSMLCASLFVVTFYPLQCPVWALLLSLGMATFFIIPMGIIQATTNTQIGLNNIMEFVAGILLPGRPLANITFKVYGYMTMSQCLNMASDLKMGIYAKIPPKEMFIFHTCGTAIGAVISYIFIRSVIADKRELLDGTVSDPSGQWTGRKSEIFYSASVIWGLIGPLKFFSGKYRVLFWGFPIGALLPIIPWIMSRNNPKSAWRQLSIPR